MSQIDSTSALTTTLADFPELEALPALSELALSPTESHGIYCGLMCSGAAEPQERWLDEIFSGVPASEDAARCRGGLTRLAEQTRARIEGPELGFAPLLPDADASLATRAEAVHDWSRGFLYGLGLAGCDPNSLSGEAREALDDLAEITRLDLQDLHDLDETEDSEQSLAEISEFLWVAAMLVYEERGRCATAGGCGWNNPVTRCDQTR